MQIPGETFSNIFSVAAANVKQFFSKSCKINFIYFQFKIMLRKAPLPKNLKIRVAFKEQGAKKPPSGWKNE